MCGGRQGDNHFLSDFYSVDYESHTHDLAPMKYKRASVSLSGLPTRLIAIGGKQEGGSTMVCEEYFVSLNQWHKLPSLPSPRSASGTILLKSRKAFSFCGNVDFRMHLHHINYLQLDVDTKWHFVFLDNKLAQTSQLAAVSVGEGRMLLFGGWSPTSKVTYMMSEGGEILEKFEEDPHNPHTMCYHSYTAREGKVFTVMRREVTEGEWKSGVVTFEGKKWEFI